MASEESGVTAAKPRRPLSAGSGAKAAAFVWWASMTILAVTLLRIWHVVLFKIDLRFLGLAWLVLLGWVCIGVAYRMERASHDNESGTPPRLWSARSEGFWVMLAVFSVLLALFHVGYMRAASDGRGYFAQARSIAIEGDLDFANDVALFAAREQDVSFPIGTALLWTPFMLLAHAWLGLMNLLGDEHVRDGFTNPYQRAVGLGTLLYGFGAFTMIFQAVRREFDRATSIIAVTAIVLATPIVWYLTIDSSMSHGVSLFAATVFLFVWLAIRQESTRARWCLLGITGVAMILVRPQNILFASVPLLDGLVRAWERESPTTSPGRPTAWRLGPLALALALGSIVVLGGYEVMREYITAQNLFTEFSPLQVLFSPQHGLISNSPILAMAFLGLPFLSRHDRGLALGMSTVVALQVIVNAASPGWDGGASFGARRFVACALPFAFGLAAIIDEGRRRPLVPVGIVVASIAVVNLLVVDETRKGNLTLSDPVPFSTMTEIISQRMGNPFALPGAAVFAQRHGVPLGFLDRAAVRRHRVLDVNVGSDGDQRFLTGSLFGREFGGGRSFRWASQPEVVLLARLAEDSYRLSFVAAPFVDPGSGPQTIEVWVDDRFAESFSLAPGFSRYEVDPSFEILPGPDWVRVSFRFGYSVSPEELGLSDDSRRLAVQFDSIRLEPR